MSSMRHFAGLVLPPTYGMSTRKRRLLIAWRKHKPMQSQSESTSHAAAGHCPCCVSTRSDFVATLSFDAVGGPVASDIYRCSDCGTYRRKLRAPLGPEDHFQVSSYTQEDDQTEASFRQDRAKFFDQILGLAGPPGMLLDVGCSYGHMMERAHAGGWRCHGTELLERLRTRLNQDGRFKTFATVDEIRGSVQYDAITLIDSLYYFERPTDLLRDLVRQLRSDGRIVIRIANRCPLADLQRAMGLPVTNMTLGDQLVAFSHQGMNQLLARCGLRMDRVILRERKPISIHRIARSVGYQVLPVVAGVIRKKVTPGIIYVCRLSK
jgi:SAM-dependent methyltransferase